MKWYSTDSVDKVSGPSVVSFPFWVGWNRRRQGLHRDFVCQRDRVVFRSGLILLASDPMGEKITLLR